MKIGARLKTFRLAAGLTQEQLAKKVNLSKANISKYESDDIEPNLATLNMFAKIFGTTTDNILGITNNSPPAQKQFRPDSKNWSLSADDPTPPGNNEKPKPPDIQWGDFGISFYEGRKKLTQKQKDRIAKLVQIAVMEDWEEENKNQ